MQILDLDGSDLQFGKHSSLLQYESIYGCKKVYKGMDSSIIIKQIYNFRLYRNTFTATTIYKYTNEY